VTPRNALLVSATAILVMAYSTLATPSWADSISELAQKSRHLADAGKWNEAQKVLEDRLAQTKDSVEVAQLKAELAHYAAERNAYFHKDDQSVRARIQEARSANRAPNDKQALGTLEMAEGQFTYWRSTKPKPGVRQPSILIEQFRYTVNPAMKPGLAKRCSIEDSSIKCRSRTHRRESASIRLWT